MKIIRGELTPASLTPPTTRYNSTCNCIQVTSDGGTTWTEAVGQDPRTQPAYLKPPVAGSTKQCDSAANMVAWLKSIIDTMIAALDGGATDILLVNNLLQFLGQIFPFAAYFIDLMFELAVILLATGATDLNTAFDDATYDALKCIFYCHCDSDGRINQTALEQAEADIVLQLNTTAAVIVNEILFITGFVGVSNAGAGGTETGDCGACECGWCFRFDFTTGFNSFTPLVNEFGTYGTTNALGIRSAFFAAPAFANLMQVNMTRDFGGLDVTSIEVVTNDPDWNGTPSQFYVNNDGTNLLLENMNPDFQSHTISGANTLHNLTIGTSQANQGSSQYHYVVSLLLRGAGANPFGLDNCV